MRSLNQIGKDEIKDYLGKGWLTHDGMWFYSTYKELGIDLANKLNKEAVKSMSSIEAERTRRIFGVSNGIESFEEMAEFLQKALEIVLPSSVFGRIHLSVPSKNTVHWEWEDKECFAYKGMDRLGVADQYKCAVICRIECWLDALGIRHTVDPKIEGCLMAEKGHCSGDLVFCFKT
ncbi:MAG: DUF6125 family protein [Candidatus Atabeyarchaeum deiterrae]